MQLVKPTAPEAYQAIFQTMVAVVTLEGTQEMVPLERESIEAIGHYIFDHDVSIDELPQVLRNDCVVQSPFRKLGNPSCHLLNPRAVSCK
jgi:hypothetical protein